MLDMVSIKLDKNDVLESGKINLSKELFKQCDHVDLVHPGIIIDSFKKDEINEYVIEESLRKGCLVEYYGLFDFEHFHLCKRNPNLLWSFEPHIEPSIDVDDNNRVLEFLFKLDEIYSEDPYNLNQENAQMKAMKLCKEYM